MTNTSKILGLATSAAVVALSAAPVAAYANHQKPAAKAPAAGEAVVHCYGINTCKGSSDCATAKTSCKGQNECKGQGFKALTTSQCGSMGGTTTAPAA